jgi:hypothetical protein
MLMGANDSGINHLIFVIGVCAEHLKYLLPNAFLRPATESRMDDPKVTEALRQITPGNARAISVEHRFDKQAIVTSRHADISRLPWQQRGDAFPLVISEGISSSRHQAFIIGQSLTILETINKLFISLIDDTP